MGQTFRKFRYCLRLLYTRLTALSGIVRCFSPEENMRNLIMRNHKRFQLVWQVFHSLPRLHSLLLLPTLLSSSFLFSLIPFFLSLSLSLSLCTDWMRGLRCAVDRVCVSAGSACVIRPASAVCTAPTASVTTSPASASEGNSVGVSNHGDDILIETHTHTPHAYRHTDTHTS